jgi:hypothetical protein
MNHSFSSAVFGGLAIFAPMAARADSLTCMPATLCIDDDCQNGHDARLAITLQNWTSAHPKLVSDYGNVKMTRGKGDAMKWTGRNAEGQDESLTVKADMTFVHVVTMEPTSAVGTLTAKGRCEVTK